uniref:Uncharacterized protein n=1 Tax=Arundo donax TaxID=35708 RepID=A0A0A8YTX6_ARUDO
MVYTPMVDGSVFISKLVHTPWTTASGPLEPILAHNMEEVCAVGGTPLIIPPALEQKSDGDNLEGTPKHVSYR